MRFSYTSWHCKYAYPICLKFPISLFFMQWTHTYVSSEFGWDAWDQSLFPVSAGSTWGYLCLHAGVYFLFSLHWLVSCLDLWLLSISMDLAIFLQQIQGPIISLLFKLMRKWWLSCLNYSMLSSSRNRWGMLLQDIYKNNTLFYSRTENKFILLPFLIERTPYKESICGVLCLWTAYCLSQIKFMLRNYLCLLNILKLRNELENSFSWRVWQNCSAQS